MIDIWPAEPVAVTGRLSPPVVAFAKGILLANRIVITAGFVPSTRLPRTCCPQLDAPDHTVTKLPAGTTDESMARTTLVPATNPGIALLEASGLAADFAVSARSASTCACRFGDA